MLLILQVFGARPKIFNVLPDDGARKKVRGSPKLWQLMLRATYAADFRGNSSNSCQEISFKTTKVTLTVALQEKSGDQQHLH